MDKWHTKFIYKTKKYIIELSHSLLRFTHKVKADMIENKNKIEKNGDLIYFEIRKYAFPTFEISKFQINIFKTEISNQLIFARGGIFHEVRKSLVVTNNSCRKSVLKSLSYSFQTLL